MASERRRASRSITLALIGSIGILWGFKSCTRQDQYDEDDPASTQPSDGSSGYWDSTHHWHPYHSSGFSTAHSSSSFSHSSSSSSHSSGTSRGGFGSTGSAHSSGGSS